MTVTAPARPAPSPDIPGARPSGGPDRQPVSVVSFGPLILSASVAAAFSRLVAHGFGSRVLLPMLVGIVVADLVTALAVRLRLTTLLAVAIGAAVACVALVLVVDPMLFEPGAPGFLHGSTLWAQLRVAHSALANDGTPLPLLPGVVLLVGFIGAGAAALTRGVWSRSRGRAAGTGGGPLLPCLAPSLAIFIYTTLVSGERGRVPALLSYFLGGLVFVALADRASSAPPQATGPEHAIARSGSTGGAVATCLVVAAVVLAAGAGLSGLRLSVFHVTPPPPSQTSTGSLGPHGAPQSLLTGIALVDHLLATEITESKVVVFHAESPVTTYWAVGTLTSFNGREWLPVSGVSGALSGSAGPLATSLGPVTLPAPKPTQTFTARVAITDFASRLLPAPPDALAVHGLVGASAIDEEGVLAATASTTGTSYSVTAGLHETIPSTGRQLASTDPRLAPYLALPAQPAVVAQLARQAVGDATTPAAKAQALVNWFRSGQFRYTLSPPATTGPDPLVQFLTVTKAGFCEQFAGAYGVLARALGIPTRLVVGFTPGRAGAGDSFTVTGADAHVWPQVYLGPAVGWVSVEPTPPVPGTPTAPGVVGASASPPPAGASTATSSPTTVPAGAPSTVPARSRGTGLGAHHRAHVPTHPGSTWWVVAAVVVGLLVLGALAAWALRRRRAAVEARLLPDQRVVRAWDQALTALRRTGMARREEETPAEFAARVHQAEHDSAEVMGSGAVTNLATLVELACYTPRPCTPAEAERARALASTIVATSRSQRRQPRVTAEWN